MVIAVVLCIIFGSGLLFVGVDNLDNRDRLRRAQERYDLQDADKLRILHECRKTIAENEKYIEQLDCVRAYGLSILNTTLPKNLKIRSMTSIELKLTRDRLDALAVKLAGENMPVESSGEESSDENH